MGRYKKLLSNTAILAVGTFASKMLVFLMMPLYTSILAADEFSVADLITQTANLLIPLACIGIVDGIFRFALDGEEDRKKTLSSGLAVLLLSSLVFSVIAVILDLVGISGEMGGYIWLVALYVICANFHSAVAQYIRARGKTLLFSFGGIVGTALTVVFNILFLVAFDMGVLGYVLSVVAADVLVTLFLFFRAKLYRDIDIKLVDKAKISEMLKYSIPMIPTTVFWWITGVSDRYMVTYMVSHEVNGLYSASYKIPTVLTLICMVFIEAWQFSAVSEKDDKARSGFFKSVFSAYQGILFMAASTLILLSKAATVLLLDSAYYESWKYIPVLAVAMTYSALVTFMGSVYLVKKKSVMSFVTSAIGAVVNVVLNLLLIPKFENSAMGAAIATFASYFAVMIIRSINTQKFVRFDMSLVKLTFNTVAVIAQAVIMTMEIRYWIIAEILLWGIVVAVNGKSILSGVMGALKNLRKKSKNI